MVTKNRRGGFSNDRTVCRQLALFIMFINIDSTSRYYYYSVTSPLIVSIAAFAPIEDS